MRNQETTSAPAEPKGWPWLAILIPAWPLIVFACYFQSIGKAFPFISRVFSPGRFSSFPTSPRIFLESFLILLLSAVIAGATWIWGKRVREFLSLEVREPSVRIAFDFGLGVCFLNLWWLGTGLNRIWFKPLWMAMGALSLVLLVLEAAQFLRAKSLPRFSRQGVDPSILFLLATGVLYLVFSLLHDLLPETFYDSMVYHLAVPSYWVLQHGISDFPTNFFSNYPFGGELYFLNGLVFQGTETAKALHALAFGACGLLACGWAREIAGAKAGWLALGLTLTLPLFCMNTWTTQVEGIQALVLLLFLYSLERWRHEPGSPSNAMGMGLFLGLALSIKYTSLLGIGAAILVLALQSPFLFKRGNGRYWILAALTALALLGPWVFKNFIFTGNPCFPYLSHWFQGGRLPEEGYRKLLEEQRAYAAHDFLSWLKLPWSLVMSNPDSYNFAGPVALAFFPLAFFYRLRHPALKFLAWVVPLFFLSGLCVTHILRFMVPAFVVFYVLLASLLGGGGRPGWARGGALAAGVSAVLCFFSLAAISSVYYAGGSVWWGKQSRPDYLADPGRLTSYYGMAQWISKARPPEERILVAGDSRGLYYDRSFLANSVFDDQVLAKFAKGEKDATGIARRLQEMGVDSIVVNGDEGIRVSDSYHHYDLTTAEWERLDDFIQQGTDLVYAQGLQAVYQIRKEFRSTAPRSESPDLLLFFSHPATRFMDDWRKQKWVGADQDMEEVLKLYPFSDYWKRQASEMEKVLKKL